MPSPLDNPAQRAALMTTLPLMLSVAAISVTQLFVMPGDPLPRAITRLVGLDQAIVQRMTARKDPATLETLVTTEPTMLFYLMLVGWLVYDSPLGKATIDRIGLTDQPEQQQALAAMFRRTMVLLAYALPDMNKALAQELAVRELFAQEKHTLVPYLPAAYDWETPPATPAEATNDDDIWMTMTPLPAERNMFAYAINMTSVARYGEPTPLGQMLAGVAALGTGQQLLALARRFRNTPADEPLDVNGPDLVRLYLCLHIFALLCLTDRQPVLMDRLKPQPDKPAPWDDPEQQQKLVQHVGILVEALTMIFDEQFADRPAYQAAQAEVQRLAALA